MRDLPDRTNVPPGRAPRKYRYSPRRLTRSERVAWELRQAQPDGECLITTAKLSSRGYGMVTERGKKLTLPRLIVEQAVGRKLGRWEFACHTCHRPACINPDHLYLGTPTSNMQDKVRAGRARNGYTGKL